jgi:hypothetical protein
MTLTEVMPSHEVAIPHAARMRLRYWLALEFVGVLLILCGAFLFVGGEAEAQEAASLPEPAGDGAPTAGSSAEPNATDAESRSAPESAPEPSPEPSTAESLPAAPSEEAVSSPEPSAPTTTGTATTSEPAPTMSDTVSEPTPTESVTTAPTPESPSQPAPEPEPTPDPVPAPAEEPQREPAPEPTPEPALESAPDPVPTPIEEQPSGSVPAPTPESVPEPALQPTPEPAPQPTPESAPGPSVGTAPSPPVSETAPAVPVATEPIASEPNALESAPMGSDREAATPGTNSEPATAPVALTSKLSDEPAPEESSKQSVPDVAAGAAVHHSKSPDGDVAAARLAKGFARAVDTLLGSLPERTARLVERTSDVVGWLVRALSGVLGGLVDSTGMPIPGGDPLNPPAAPVPTAPPPAVPILVGGSSLVGGSFSGESVSSGGKSKKLIQQFAVLDDVLSLPFLQGSERPWTWREPLRPNSAPRPPNERPG